MTAKRTIKPTRHLRQQWCLTIWLMFAAAIALCPDVGLSAQQPTYTVYALEQVTVADTPYETFAKNLTEEANGIRFVVGYAQSNNLENEPVLWTVESTGDSSATLLGYPTEWFAGAVATAINNHGQIIGGGLLHNTTGAGAGLYWPDAASSPVVLPGVMDEISSQVQQISDDGIVVGFSNSPTGSKAVAWQVLADDTVVGPLVLPTRPRATTGNDAALAVRPTADNVTQIVGRSAGAAVVWRVRSTGNSLTLDGAVEILDSTGEATDIDSMGAVCGNDRS